MTYMKNILTYEDYINEDFNSDGKLYKILGDDPKYKAINVTDKDVSIVSKILGEYYEVTKQRTIGFDEDIKRYSVTRIVTSWRETGKMDHPPKYNIFIYRLADYYYLVAWFNMVESLKYALCDSEAGLEQLLRDLSSQKINEI